MQIKKALQGFHLRVMTQGRFLECQILRFQVGQLIQHYISSYEPPVWVFHMRGYGSTCEAALAMAGLPWNVRLSEEIH